MDKLCFDSAFLLFAAPASTRLVQVSAGELETAQLDTAPSDVVDKTSNASAGTPDNECTVAAFPVFVVKD